MRGDDAICGRLFSYIDLEKRVRADHPLRLIWAIANTALKSLSSGFQQLYSPLGRASIPPERLMRALLRPPPIRPTAKPGNPLLADNRGSQSALKFAIFQHPVSGDFYCGERYHTRISFTVDASGKVTGAIIAD